MFGKETLSLRLLFLVVFVLAWPSVGYGNYVNFYPSASIDFRAAYFGEPQTYVEVNGSGTGWGSFDLTQAISGPANMQVVLDVMTSTGNGFGEKTWWFYDLQNLTPGVAVAIPSKTASLTASVWLPDEDSVIPVTANVIMYYSLFMEHGTENGGGQGSLATADFVVMAPEPCPWLLIAGGLGTLLCLGGRRGRR